MSPTASLLLVVLSAASPQQLVMMPLPPGEGVTPKTAEALAEAVVAQLRRHPGVTVTTPQELSTLLSHEQQKQLLGCDGESCLAEVGAALGADALVTGSIARLGESWLAHLKLIDTRKAATISHADERLRGGSIDDLLDAIPALVGRLLADVPRPATAGGTTPAVVASTAGAAAIPAVTVAAPTPPPPGGADEPLQLTIEERGRLHVVTDGQGHYIAFDAQGGTGGLLLAGDAKGLHAQYLIGFSSSADEISFTFWDSRFRDGWQRSFAKRGSDHSVQCGDRKIELTPVTPKQTRRLLANAKLFKPRWRRQAHAIARDDAGTYYFVDRAREPADNQDFRLYVGSKGALAYLPVTDAIIDPRSELIITAAGRLAISSAGDGSATWIQGERRQELVLMNLYQAAPMIYTSLGAYTGQALGTACDPWMH